MVGRGRIFDQISGARRASMLRAALRAEEKEHYSEALATYRQILEQYPDSEEALEAEDRMVLLADVFDNKGHVFRARDIRMPLQQIREIQEDLEAKEQARQERVEEILDEVYGRG